MNMKRSSVVVMSVAFLFLGVAVVINNCGGGGGGSTPAPQAPSYNLTGNWKETQIVPANNGCGAPGVTNIVFWSFSQQEGSNTVVATDLTNPGTVNLNLSGATLTYTAPFDSGGGCTSATQSLSVTFTSANLGTGTQTVTCNSNGGTCTATLNETFEKQ
jgi:hypothetical protein